MRRLGMIVVAGCLMISTPSPSLADDYTGNQILRDCNQGNDWPSGSCFGRIIGSVDGFRVKAALDKTGLPFCIPEGVTNGQVVDIVVRWVRDQPAKRHYNYEVITGLALKEAFPCKTAQ